MAQFKYATTGAAPSAGAWTTIGASDLSTAAQGYSTVNLTSSSESGFDHRISIGDDTGRAANSADISQRAILYFDTGISVDDLGDGDSNTGVIQISFEPFGVDNTSSYRTDVTYPQGVMLFTTLETPP